ncbi:unnamed protein product, partial [Mesorhabditis belari]|uniref:C2H2-type domain-containing protein n=1 Tax=Mesorhabditis belari TaxID=2138241 RepID=A0AAF3FKA6_9BILA
MTTATPRFVIGVLQPGADIMQIYSSLTIGGCSEISFVKDLKNSLLCKAQALEEAQGEIQGKVDEEEMPKESNRRKRKRPQPIREHSPSSSPSSSGCIPTSLLSIPSPDQNLTLVLNGIVNAENIFASAQHIKEESPIPVQTDTEALSSHSPPIPDPLEAAPFLLSRVFGVGLNDRKENFLSSFDDGDDDGMIAENEVSEYGNGRKKGPVVECKRCASKIIMQQTRSLFRHIMTHASQEPYRCSECLQSSANSFNLRTHIYRKHDGKAEIIPNRTFELEAEWRSLARECFPNQQDRIDRCISYFVNSGSETLPLNATEGKPGKAVKI